MTQKTKAVGAGAIVLSLVAGITYFANKNTAPQNRTPESQVRIVNSQTGLYSNETTSDTFLFGDQTTYQWQSFHNVNGVDSAHPVVLKCVDAYFDSHGFGNGFEIDDCKNLVILGVAKNQAYGCRINGAFFSIFIRGKCDNIKVFGIEMYGNPDGGSGITFKTDVGYVSSYYKCDTSYLWPARMGNLEVANCYIHDIQDEGMYIGETAPYAGTRSFSCYGKTRYDRPMGLYNINIHNNILQNIGRQGIQVGGADSGYTHIYNNTLHYIGNEYAQDQGVGIYIGGGTQNAEVDHNTINGTWLDAIKWTGTGLGYPHDNTADSTAILPRGSGFDSPPGNGQTVWKIPAYTFIAFENPDHKDCSIKAVNNTSGWATATDRDVDLKIGGGASVWKSVCISSSGVVSNSTGKSYSTDCIDTTGTIKDTSITSVSVSFNRADGSKYIPVNWRRLVDRDSVYFIKFKDSSGKTFKKKR